MNELKIGTIVTNGINHWMVWSITGDDKCEHCKKGESKRIKVVPVIMENGKPVHICFDYRGEYWLNKEISSIRPFWYIATNIY